MCWVLFADLPDTSTGCSVKYFGPYVVTYQIKVLRIMAPSRSHDIIWETGNIGNQHVIANMNLWIYIHFFCLSVSLFQWQNIKIMVLFQLAKKKARLPSCFDRQVHITFRCAGLPYPWLGSKKGRGYSSCHFPLPVSPFRTNTGLRGWLRKELH